MGIADDDGGLGVGLDGLGEGREGPEQYEGPTDEAVARGQRGMNPAPKRRRKSSNYALERLLETKEREGGGPAAPDLWEQIKDGFASPEQALEFPVKTKVQGVFRAVRIASACYEVDLITPEPVVKVSKIKERGSK